MPTNHTSTPIPCHPHVWHTCACLCAANKHLPRHSVPPGERVHTTRHLPSHGPPPSTRSIPQGRALVASRAIRQGEVVVELPDGAVLMAENCGIADVLEGGSAGGGARDCAVLHGAVGRAPVGGVGRALVE